jgi:DNA-binding MarR family transcriptional regulator
MIAQSEQNTLLAAVYAMRGAFPALTLRQSIAFLYVCENEGLNMRELAFVSKLSEQAISRGVRGMAEGAPQHASPPLLRLQRHPFDNRLRLVFLSEAGAALRDRVSHAIAGRSPIRTDGAIAAAA